MNNVLMNPKKSSALTRRERRNEELALRKIRSRTYTFAEMEQIIKNTTAEIESRYDRVYTTGLAVVLNAEPLNFGPKRVCRTVGLFFEQIHAMNHGIVDEDQVLTAAAKLGVVVTHNDKGGVEVLVKDHSRANKE